MNCKSKLFMINMVIMNENTEILKMTVKFSTLYRKLPFTCWLYIVGN